MEDYGLKELDDVIKVAHLGRGEGTIQTQAAPLQTPFIPHVLGPSGLNAILYSVLRRTEGSEAWVKLNVSGLRSVATIFPN